MLKPPTDLPQYWFHPNWRPVALFAAVTLAVSCVLAAATQDWRGLLLSAGAITYLLVMAVLIGPILYNIRVAVDVGDEVWTKSLFRWHKGCWSDVTGIAFGFRGGLMLFRSDGSRQHLFWNLQRPQKGYTLIVVRHILALPFPLPKDVQKTLHALTTSSDKTYQSGHLQDR